MISVAQFKKEIVEITYPGSNETVIKGDTSAATEWCLEFLMDEGCIEVVGGQMYIYIDLQNVFYTMFVDHTLDEIGWEIQSDEIMKRKFSLFPIATVFPIMEDCTNNKMAILFWFDKFLGYDSLVPGGVGLTFSDLKKYYNLYREKVDPDIPAFEVEIRNLFKANATRFLKLMGESLWEISGPVLKGTRGGDAVDSISEINTAGMKLLYWSWVRESSDEFECGFYNGISLSFIDLAHEGKMFEVIVNFEDNNKESEERLLKELIRNTAINLSK